MRGANVLLRALRRHIFFVWIAAEMREAALPNKFLARRRRCGVRDYPFSAESVSGRMRCLGGLHRLKRKRRGQGPAAVCVSMSS
jgi:hypothetical protein